MVPYVRKSFARYYCQGLKYLKNKNDNYINKNFNNIDITKISIEDHKIYKNKKVYRYATDLLTKEINQAVEGMFHNLNSLQSRSGNQLKWMAG